MAASFERIYGGLDKIFSSIDISFRRISAGYRPGALARMRRIPREGRVF
jgi:hypothetical protein